MLTRGIAICLKLIMQKDDWEPKEYVENERGEDEGSQMQDAVLC